MDTGTCDVFVGPDGGVMEVMCCDYGFRSGFGRLYQGEDGEIPLNIFQLAWDNFKKEFQQIRRSFRFNEYAEISRANPPSNVFERAVNWTGSKVVGGLSSIDVALEDADILKKLDPEDPPASTDDDITRYCREVRTALADLTLDDAAVWVKEGVRRQQPNHPKAPWFITWPYLSLCWVLDAIYANRPIQRFWFLETVARMPYFAYISMLHLYETLGWWRAGAELRRVHFAQEWNELHHLQIMESLGGDQFWVDRFMAQHAAVFYYWVLIVFFALFPSLAYMFSELVEGHAVDTYDEFVESNKAKLEKLPPPLVALKYYKGGDLYFFDYLQTKGGEPRRPECRTLYDVFKNIREDEKEHVKTMTACRDYSIMGDLVNKANAKKDKDGNVKVSPPPAEASIKTMN